MADYVRTTPERRQDLIQCNRLAKEQAAFEPAELSTRLDGLVEGDRLGVYQILGTFAFDSFMHAHSISKGSPNHLYGAGPSGFKVLANLLAYAPAAWQRFQSETGQTHDTETLRSALKASSEICRRFSFLPFQTNQDAERAFDLHMLRPSTDNPLLRFEDTHRGPLYIADDDTYYHNTDRPFYTSNMPPHWQRCPADRLIRLQLWPAMVDLAVDTPQVFPAHLESLATPVQ